MPTFSAGKPVPIFGHLLTMASALAVLALTSAAAASETPAKEIVPDLAASCQPEAVRTAIANLLPTIAIKQLPNPVGPAFATGTHFFAAGNGIPAFCQVTGSFVTNPKTGKTANFLATFPQAWNGKYLQLGCSGHCGQFAVSNPAMPFVTITTQGYPGEIITKGYAAFATDEGHVGFAGGTWAIKGPGKVDEDAITDLYYRADKVLAKLGKAFTLAFYGHATKAPQKIARSYFSGCSGGGRDAFVAASYFPQEFDGIIGGSAYTESAAFQMAGVPLATLRSKDADVSAALISRIDPIVKAQCDKLDGVADGLIQNPAACNFRPERDLPRCDGKMPSDQCFTQAQIETVSTLLTAITDEDGRIVQPGYSVSDVKHTAFEMPTRPKDLSAPDPWPDSDNGMPNNGYWPLANALIKVFVHKNDPEFYTRSLFTFKSGGPGAVTDYHIVVPKAEVAQVMAQTRLGNGHFPENAAKLIELNRKFLIWENLSDQILTPYMAINYYKKLAKLQGGYEKLQKNVRLFGIPDSAHCSMSGVGPDDFDALAAMEDWVEKDKAPEALLATLYNPNTPMLRANAEPLWTMKLCKFPEMAHYSGHGDTKDAANWSCPNGDRSMLKIGESGRQAGVVQ